MCKYICMCRQCSYHRSSPAWWQILGTTFLDGEGCQQLGPPMVVVDAGNHGGGLAATLGPATEDTCSRTRPGHGVRLSSSCTKLGARRVCVCVIWHSLSESLDPP